MSAAQRTTSPSPGASEGGVPGTAGELVCLNTDVKRQSGFGTPPLVGVGCWVSWSFQGWGWGPGVSREGVRLVKGRAGCGRPVCPHPEERGVASPAQLFVCVHTALACVWGAGRGGDRARRSGDSRGPDYRVNRPARPLAVPVGVLVMCMCPRARALPGYLDWGSCGYATGEPLQLRVRGVGEGVPDSRWRGRPAVPRSAAPVPPDSAVPGAGLAGRGASARVLPPPTLPTRSG